MAKGVGTKQFKTAPSGSGNSKKTQIKLTRSKNSINFQWSKYVIKSYLTTYRGVTILGSASTNVLNLNKLLKVSTFEYYWVLIFHYITDYFSNLSYPCPLHEQPKDEIIFLATVQCNYVSV